MEPDIMALNHETMVWWEHKGLTPWYYFTLFAEFTLSATEINKNLRIASIVHPDTRLIVSVLMTYCFIVFVYRWYISNIRQATLNKLQVLQRSQPFPKSFRKLIVHSHLTMVDISVPIGIFILFQKCCTPLVWLLLLSNNYSLAGSCLYYLFGL